MSTSSYINKTAQTFKRFSSLTSTCNSLLWVYQAVRFFVWRIFAIPPRNIFVKGFFWIWKKKCRQISRKKLWNHKKNRRILVLYQIELNPFVADHHFVWYGEQPIKYVLVAGCRNDTIRKKGPLWRKWGNMKFVVGNHNYGFSSHLIKTVENFVCKL
jgi:hypothetical protein